MSRGGNLSLAMPVILGLVIAVLLYFCWGASSQTRRLKQEDQELRRQLGSVRNEKDNLQYRVNLQTDQLKQCQTGRAEAEKLSAENAEKLSEMTTKLEEEHSQRTQCEGDARQFQERAGQLQSENTQLSSEMATLQQTARSCEDSLSALQAKASEYDVLLAKNSQLEDSVQSLRQTNDDLTFQVSDQTSRLQRLEAQLAECTLHNPPAGGVANQAAVVDQLGLAERPPQQQQIAGVAGAEFNLPDQQDDQPVY